MNILAKIFRVKKSLDVEDPGNREREAVEPVNSASREASPENAVKNHEREAESNPSTQSTDLDTGPAEQRFKRITGEGQAGRLETFENAINQILEDQVVKSRLDRLGLNDSQRGWVDERLAEFQRDEQSLLDAPPDGEQPQEVKELDARLMTILTPLGKVCLNFRASDSREVKRNAAALGTVFSGTRKAMKDNKFRCFRGFCKRLGYSHTQAYKLADLAESFGDELEYFHDFDLTTLHRFKHLGNTAAAYVREHQEEIRNATSEELKAMVARTKPPGSGNSHRKSDPKKTTIRHGPCVAAYSTKMQRLTADNFPSDWADQFFVWLRSLPLARELQTVTEEGPASGNSVDANPESFANHTLDLQHNLLPDDWPPLESTVLSYEDYDFSPHLGLDEGQPKGFDLRGVLIVRYSDAFERIHTSEPRPLLGPHLPVNHSELIHLWEKTLVEYPHARSITIVVADQFMAGVRMVQDIPEARWTRLMTS